MVSRIMVTSATPTKTLIWNFPPLRWEISVFMSSIMSQSSSMEPSAEMMPRSTSPVNKMHHVLGEEPDHAERETDERQDEQEVRGLGETLGEGDQAALDLVDRRIGP